MNSEIDEYLNDIDAWKLKLHKRLKGMTATQRRAFWNRIHDEARARGPNVVEPDKPVKRPAKRIRRSA